MMLSERLERIRLESAHGENREAFDAFKKFVDDSPEMQDEPLAALRNHWFIFKTGYLMAKEVWHG